MVSNRRNTIGRQLKEVLSSNYTSKVNVERMHNQIKRHIESAKRNLNISKHENPELMDRLNAASKEISLIEDSKDRNVYGNVTNLCRVVDAMNNIGHVYLEIGNRESAREFMFAKSLGILKLGKECIKNKDTAKFGLSKDPTKRVNKDGVVVDVAGIGQVSWHIPNGLAATLKNHGARQYPYRISKGGRTNSELLNLERRHRSNRVRRHHRGVVRQYRQGLNREAGTGIRLSRVRTRNKYKTINQLRSISEERMRNGKYKDNIISFVDSWIDENKKRKIKSKAKTIGYDRVG